MWRFCKCIYKSNFWRVATIFWNQGNFRSLLDISLKVKTSNDRTNSTQIQYKVDDSTIIKHLKTSEFLSHIKAKQDMTVYLSKKLKTALTKTNISYKLQKQMLDRRDGFWSWFIRAQSRRGWYLNYFTLFSSSKIDPFREVVIVCSDKDVLLMLLYWEITKLGNLMIMQNSRAGTHLLHLLKRLMMLLCYFGILLRIQWKNVLMT